MGACNVRSPLFYTNTLPAPPPKLVTGNKTGGSKLTDRLAKSAVQVKCTTVVWRVLKYFVCWFVYLFVWRVCLFTALVPCILVSIQNNKLPAAGLTSQALFFSRRRSLPVFGLWDEIPPQASDENVGGDLGSRAILPPVRFQLLA